ncbi:MAG: glycosyltransferase family 4 protein [Thermoanaerobaculia bacterium]
MRVLFFSSNYPPHHGGLEVMARMLVEGLARRHDVELVAHAFGEAASTRVEQGAKIHRIAGIHVTESWGVPYPIPTDLRLPSILRSLRRADVVVSHGALYATTFLARHVARRFRAPLVLIEHVGFVPYRQRMLRALQAAAWRALGDAAVANATAVVTYNARVESWLRARFPGARVQFIGNGVDNDAFAPQSPADRVALRSSFALPADVPVVLFVGRVAGKKNLDSVLAIPRDGFRLVVCGGSGRRLPDDVVDLGVVPHGRMPALYACADAMLHASIGEGFPLAVQEGLASGLPIVLLWDEGYRASLSREVVVACDGLEAMGGALRRLLGDGARRRELAKRGREWALDRWTWHATIDGYESLLGALVAEGGK